MGSRLTQLELAALCEAAGFRLAADPEDDPYDADALQSAHQKLSYRLDRAAPTGSPTEDDHG